MTNKTATSKFNVDDIVTIAKGYKDSVNLDFAQPQIQVYYVMKVNVDATITLDGVMNDIPAKYIERIPIESELAKQLYYDTNQARQYEPGKVYQHEDVYSRPPFMVTMEETLGSTPLWEKMQAEKFHYIHEIQRWLIEYVDSSGICVNQFYGMRKPV